MNKLVELSAKMTIGLSLFLTAIIIFFAAVTWIAANKVILFVAPIFISLTAIFGVLVMLITINHFHLERAAKRAGLRRDRTLAGNEAKTSDLQVERDVMRMRAESRLLAASIRQVERGLIHPASLGNDTKFSSYPLPAIKHFENDAVPMLEAPPLPLLPAISNCDNILIVGGKGSGKTTLLQHLESERLDGGQKTIILDSHSQPGQWQGQMVGNGRGYSKIKNAMVGLNDMLDDRYKSFATGHSEFGAIHTFIDEFTLLPKHLKTLGYNIQDYSFVQLTEGRKVKMNCLWGIHSDRAKALGLEGAKDLIECFDAVVYLKNVAGERYAICDFGDGKQDRHYTHPGPFVLDQKPSSPPVSNLSFVVADPEPEPEDSRPTDEEMKAIEAFVSVRDGGKFSWRKATELAYGPGKFGKANNEKLRSTLSKFGIDYSDV